MPPLLQSHSAQLDPSAPYELLAGADERCVWGRLQQAGSRPVRLATVWGAAACVEGQVSVWTSDPPEASREAALGRTPRRRGLARLLGGGAAGVPVARRDLDDSDVVLAVLLALHPRGTTDWPAAALSKEVQRSLVRTVVTRRRDDGSRWHPAGPADADAVAALVCAMARTWCAEPGAPRLAELALLAEHLPDSRSGCREALAAWAGPQAA